MQMLMSIALFVLWIFLAHIQMLDGATIKDNTNDTPESQKFKWIDASLEWTRKENCTSSMDHQVCWHIHHRDRHQMNVYTAISDHKKVKLHIILADKIFRKQRYVADAVIVIDVFPELAFGHPIFIYAVKRSQNRQKCLERLGKFVNDDDCIFAVKVNHHKTPSMTETLPRVYFANDNSLQQRLTCRSEMAGFGPCQSRMNYQHQWKNVTSAIESHPPIQFKSCGTNKTESIAILINGFWNNQMSLPHYRDNIIQLRNNLINLGYQKENIITFFGGKFILL